MLKQNNKTELAEIDYPINSKMKFKAKIDNTIYTGTIAKTVKSIDGKISHYLFKATHYTTPTCSYRFSPSYYLNIYPDELQRY